MWFPKKDGSGEESSSGRCFSSTSTATPPFELERTNKVLVQLRQHRNFALDKQNGARSTSQSCRRTRRWPELPNNDTTGTLTPSKKDEIEHTIKARWYDNPGSICGAGGPNPSVRSRSCLFGHVEDPAEETKKTRSITMLRESQSDAQHISFIRSSCGGQCADDPCFDYAASCATDEASITATGSRSSCSSSRSTRDKRTCGDEAPAGKRAAAVRPPTEKRKEHDRTAGGTSSLSVMNSNIVSESTSRRLNTGRSATSRKRKRKTKTIEPDDFSNTYSCEEEHCDFSKGSPGAVRHFRKEMEPPLMQSGHAAPLADLVSGRPHSTSAARIAYQPSKRKTAKVAIYSFRLLTPICNSIAMFLILLLRIFSFLRDILARHCGFFGGSSTASTSKGTLHPSALAAIAPSGGRLRRTTATSTHARGKAGWSCSRSSATASKNAENVDLHTTTSVLPGKTRIKNQHASAINKARSAHRNRSTAAGGTCWMRPPSSKKTTLTSRKTTRTHWLLSSRAAFTKTLFYQLQLLPLLTFAWHYIPGSNESNIFYTFQEFYTDAQYGPDFGYYSKGRILQGEFFNSYTTFPMGLSPMFGNLIADRLYATWLAMAKPPKFDIFEFGGGTGVLARDILLRIEDRYPMMVPATKYTLGERAAGLRRQQKKTIKAANLTHSDQMFQVREADAREAARLKQPGDKFVGAVISNELLDEFDPVKLRLIWETGKPPNPSEVRSCRTWREVYVMHRVDKSLLLNSNWQREASAIVCAYLDDPWIARLIAKQFANERRCYPYAVCCVPLLLALNKLLHYDHLFLERLEYRNVNLLMEEYEKEVADPRVLVTKEQYRMIRRAHLHDYQVEEGLLTSDKIATDQVSMLLTEERCAELTAFFARHAQRFTRAAERRDAIDGTTPLNDISSSSFLKWVVRPGEEQFAQEASKLLDQGIMIAIDYGADFEALAWLQIVKPNYEGIHIMDARYGNFCTNKGELQCPGMHDITTNVDFTNFAEAAKEKNFELVSYAPMIELERSFGFGAHEESLFPHVIEQAGGIRSAGVWGWYSTKNTEPWASFKLLIMQKQGSAVPAAGSSTLGGPGTTRPADAEPMLKMNPFHGMAQFPLLRARDEIDNCMEEVMLPSLAGAILRESKLKLNSVEPWATASILARVNPDLVYDQELERQRAIMNEYHLSILLLDYATHLSQNQCPIQWDEASIRDIAEARLLKQVFGEEALERALKYYVQVNNMTVVKPSYVSQFTPVGCMLRKGLLGYCGHNEVLNEAYVEDFDLGHMLM
ncbi:unnamed protein product [Amoebophrya sp. A120]|nr:unnamed protein product [Amoebophrya sp. A120]|eukprot:GSA120T00007708001.1